MIEMNCGDWGLEEVRPTSRGVLGETPQKEC